MKKFFVVMVSIILFSSCNLQKHTWNLYKETMAREYDWHDYPTELDKKPPNKNTFYFTLNYPACYGCPVIRYPLDGKNMLFLVDTGSSKNYITKTGLKCFFDSEEELERIWKYYDCKWMLGDPYPVTHQMVQDYRSKHK